MTGSDLLGRGHPDRAVMGSREPEPQRPIDFDETASMRVVLVTGDGPRFILPFLHTELSLVGIVEMQRQVNDDASYRERLKALIRRTRLLHYCRLQMYLRERRKGCRHYRIDHQASDALARCLDALKPDVVVAYKTPILKPEVLALSRHGFINLHPSLLPRYRGGHPILWMARNYDLEGGVSVHFMAPQADRGDLLGQVAFTIAPGTSEEDVERRAIHELGIPLTLEVLEKLRAGALTPRGQPRVSPTEYAYRHRPQQIWEMIDWNRWSLDHVWHFVRCHPFWKSRLPEMQGWRRWVDWRIGDFERQVLQKAGGELEARPGGYRIRHREGWILIVPELRLKRVLKTLLLTLLQLPMTAKEAMLQRR